MGTRWLNIFGSTAGENPPVNNMTLTDNLKVIQDDVWKMGEIISRLEHACPPVSEISQLRELNEAVGITLVRTLELLDMQ